jgi:hypothetical protein
MKETTGADFKSATDSENKKLFIETYGCQMNVADSEVIASIMQMAGYHVCETLDEADAVFMNTCSIRDNAEQKILNRLEFFHSMKKNKRRNLIVGVLGCMAERVKDDLIENHHFEGLTHITGITFSRKTVLQFNDFIQPTYLNLFGYVIRQMFGSICSGTFGIFKHKGGIIRTFTHQG